MSPVSMLSKGIEATTRKFLDSVNSMDGPAIYQIPVEEGRKTFSKLQSAEAKKLAVRIEDRQIPTGPSGSVNIRMFRPEGNNNTLPVVVYSHGAGWVFGGPDTHDRLLRDEGEEYAHKLIEAGVRVTAVRFHGTIHDFVLLNAIAETPATRGAISLACAYIKAAVGA